MISFATLRWVVFCFLLVVILVLIFLVPISYHAVNTSFDYTTYTWKTDPIVSVYIPSDYQGNICSDEYEPISVAGSLRSILEGPCGCVENDLGFQSGNASCNLASRKSNMCMTLKYQPKVTSATWRNSIICIKRGGQAAATNHETYDPRPHPNKISICPVGYKKCGEGFNQQEGAICSPFAQECPITNLLVLPANEAPPANELWETAGTFPNNNNTLFVRREYMNELPVTDVAFQLAQMSHQGVNVRGVCYKGPKQVVNNSVVADPSRLWSYNIELPPVCDVSDTRFQLVDTVSLQDHFLQNLQLTEPDCAGFSLYPLSDPRYQPALDPDYLNSGRKCDFTSKYTCVRDPYQRTDCAAEDSICDGVMNQNICGEYAHAVRAAFPENSEVTMGMYIRREVQWTDGCGAGKADVYHAHYQFVFAKAFAGITAGAWAVYNFFAVTIFCKIRFLTDHVAVGMVLLGVGLQLMLILKVMHLYESVESGDCTDPFTRDTILDRLEPVHTSFAYILTYMCFAFVLFVDAIAMTYWHCCYHPSFRSVNHPPPQRPAPATPRRTNPSTSQNIRPSGSAERVTMVAPVRATAEYKQLSSRDVDMTAVIEVAADTHCTPVVTAVAAAAGAVGRVISNTTTTGPSSAQTVLFTPVQSGTRNTNSNGWTELEMIDV